MFSTGPQIMKSNPRKPPPEIPMQPQQGMPGAQSMQYPVPHGSEMIRQQGYPPMMSRQMPNYPGQMPPNAMAPRQQPPMMMPGQTGMQQVPHPPNYVVPQPTPPALPTPNTNTLINAASSQIPPSLERTPAIQQVSPQAQPPYESSPAPQNGRDANNRMKPSEILTVSLMVGDVKIQNHKIFTKIHYGKKQFVWELSENSSLASPGHTSPSPEGSEPEKCKKKLELRFDMIEKLDVLTKPGHEHEIHISTSNSESVLSLL